MKSGWKKRLLTLVLCTAIAVSNSCTTTALNMGNVLAADEVHEAAAPEESAPVTDEGESTPAPETEADTQAPAEDESAPEAGDDAQVPAEGETTPEAGDDTQAPAEGETTPETGDDAQAPAEGETTPETGDDAQAPAEGETTPEAGDDAQNPDAEKECTCNAADSVHTEECPLYTETAPEEEEVNVAELSGQELADYLAKLAEDELAETLAALTEEQKASLKDVLDAEVWEKYFPAEETEFNDFVEIDGAKITVSAPAGVLPEDTEIVAVPVQDEEDSIKNALLYEIEEEDKNLWDYYAYDIQLLKDGEKVSFEGTVTVKFEINDYEGNENSRIYYVDGETLENMNATAEDGAVIMETTHFSEYVVADIRDRETFIGGAIGENYTEAAPFLSPIDGMLMARSNMAMLAEEKDNGLELSKSAVYNTETGKTEITLEAYTTGTVTSESKSIPTDVVLVLDQSGSMDEDFGKVYDYREYTNITVNNITWQTAYRLPQYYYKIGDKYVLLEKHMEDAGRGRCDVTFSYEENRRDVYVTCTPETPFYTRSSDSLSRLEALQRVANAFVDDIREEATTNNVNHRVAVVGFANGDKWQGESYNYKNTEVFIGKTQYRYGYNAQSQYRNAFQNMNDSRGYNNVKASIENLDGDGGTLTNLGLEMAKGILDSNPISGTEKRNRVVIVLSDGQPGWSGFTESTANAAIQQARSIKNSGATIYTISVMDGADVTGSSNTDRFMRYVSSLYPNASSMTNTGSPVEPEKGSYYMTAQDTDALQDIFQSIMDNITTPSINLDASTVVKDVVSDYFELPAGMSKSDVEIYTAACTGQNSDGSYTFGTPQRASGMNVTIDRNSKSVSVSGFNFNENFVAINESTKQPQGKKLIIKFEVDTREGFIGGNQVPTNDRDDSGVFKDGKLVENFELPTVDVPLRYFFDAQDDSIYVGDDWKQAEIFFDAADGKVKYRVAETGKEYELDGINNAFVDIAYKVIDDNNKTVGTYTVAAGTTTGTWGSGQPNMDTTTYTSDEKFNTAATVTPTKTGTYTAKTTDNKEATLHVFRPTVSCTDQTIFLGDTVDLNSSITGNVTWKCDSTGHRAEALLDGDAPALSYEMREAGTTAAITGTYKPAKETDIEIFKVTRQDSGRDITASTTIQTATESCPDGCVDAHDSHKDRDFTIHVVAGSIELTKTITEMNAKHGNPIFTFKVTNTSTGDVFYRTVEFEEAESGKVVGKLEKLPKGTYKVEELTTLRYELESIAKVDVSYPAAVRIQGTDFATVTIGNSLNQRNAKLAFTNKRVNDGGDSDTGRLINNVVMDADGSLSFQKDNK